MSEHSSNPLGQSRGHAMPGSSKPRETRAAAKRRWAIYGGLAVVAVLVLAYIDGGEVPLRPISQPVAWSAEGEVTK